MVTTATWVSLIPPLSRLPDSFAVAPGGASRGCVPNGMSVCDTGLAPDPISIVRPECAVGTGHAQCPRDGRLQRPKGAARNLASLGGPHVERRRTATCRSTDVGDPSPVRP